MNFKQNLLFIFSTSICLLFSCQETSHESINTDDNIETIDLIDPPQFENIDISVIPEPRNKTLYLDSTYTIQLVKGNIESLLSNLIIYAYADSSSKAEAQFEKLDSAHYEMKLISAPGYLRIGVEDTNYWGNNIGWGKQVGSAHYWVSTKN